MKDFLWTCSFLTIIPFNKKRDTVSPNIRNVLFWFPVIGLLIGFFLASIYFALVRFFPFSVADAIILIIYIFLTGGLHLDGLADTCDGIFGGKDKENRLRIMRDSSIGSFGAIGLICLIGAKYLCFHSIFNEKYINSYFFTSLFGSYSFHDHETQVVFQKCAALLIMPCIGRWAQTLGASTSKYARDNEPGTGLLIVRDSKIIHLFFPTIVTVCLIWYFFGLNGLVLFSIIGIILLILIRFFKSKIGGMTGDTLGAVNEMSEILFLAALLL